MVNEIPVIWAPEQALSTLMDHRIIQDIDAPPEGDGQIIFPSNSHGRSFFQLESIQHNMLLLNTYYSFIKELCRVVPASSNLLDP